MVSFLEVDLYLDGGKENDEIMIAKEQLESGYSPNANVWHPAAQARS